MTAASRLLLKKIASSEVIREDHSVFSRQWIELPHCNPASLNPAFLVESYLAFVRKCTLSIVQPSQNGGKTVFALFGSSLALLIFSGPQFSENERSQSAALRIDGGLLVQRNECGKGMLSFIIEVLGEGLQVAVEVRDYCPLLLGGAKPSKLRKWLYRCTQALIHKIITSRYLYHLHRQLESGRSFQGCHQEKRRTDADMGKRW